MKNLYKHIFGVIMLLALIGCQREEDILVATLTHSIDTIKTQYYTIDVSCGLYCNAPFSAAYVHYATQADFADYASCSMTKLNRERYSNILRDLEPGTTYFLRFEVSNSVSNLLSEGYIEVQTMPLSAPVLNTVFDSMITYNSAIVGGDIILDGGLDIKECGVVYSKTQNPNVEESGKVVCESKEHVFNCEITELEVITTYYARAYAINDKGVAYGEQIEFTTLSTTAQLGNIEATDISATTAILKGKVISDGGEMLIARGFCYNRVGEPTLEDSVLLDTIHVDSIIQCNAINLYGGTTYYVRAFATNVNGTTYSVPITFTTEKSIAVLTTYKPTDISYTYATVGGKIVHDGGAKITERGICYSTKDNPTISDTKVINTASASSFTCSITQLQDETTYYARTYAINEVGVAYGNVETFTTKTCIPPTVETKEVIDIYAKSATVVANVIKDGGANVTERGVVYSTTKNPIIDSTKVVGGQGLGDFTCELIGLKDGTTYYVRAYAINKKDTAYGEEIRFETVKMLPPTVNTIEPTLVSYTSATLGGNVTDEGGAKVTERGIVYGTSKNPIVDSTKVVCGEGKGEFICELTNLQETTTYYARSYAINEKGINYGKEVEFKTKTIVPPIVITTQPTNISYYSANVGGNVKDDGGTDITERGVVYANETNPTIDNNRIVSGNGLGEYICELTDLQDGTKYYARAYATNAKGTSYGEEVNFTTSDMVDAIDLGLSVKWASCNLGADSPEEFGNYFAWGEVNPKAYYDWSNYEWGNAESGQLTKYNWSTDYGTPDYKYVLDPEDDAATVNWGGKWRMPTKDEYDELRNNCTWEGVSRNGVCGREITASNGNKIFLPVQEMSADGYWSNTYWLSVLSTENANSAWYILMYGYSPYDNIQFAEKKGRHEGALIRPVYDDGGVKKDKPTVVTQTSMQVTKNSAVVGGDVINNGGASLLECGIIYGTSSSLTISNTKVKNNNLSLSNFYCVLSGLKENTKYYVRAYAINHEGLAYGSVESFTTQTKATATPEAVDIGLSVKWASFNVGASKPEEYGDYFAWGETEPKEMYNGNNYKWGNPDGRILTKYSTSVEYGFIDNKYTLDLEDDAAAVNFGGKWRMPTPDEFGELINTCTAKWTSLNGVKGYEIMGPNGESIFLPAAGYSHDHDGINCIEGVGRDVHCWSNTLSDDPYNAVICRFENGENYIGGGANARTEGRSVRAVYDEPITTKFPSVNINTFSNIADVSVVVECEVTDNGGASITERGIVYSTLEMPTISHNSKIMNGSGVGSYSCQITNLEPETSYYVRAYAINARGVSYSNQVRFRTLSPAVLPTVTTNAVTQITEATAVAGGNVISDGGATVTERGVCVATVSNPTISNTKVTAGSGTGSFTCDLTGLQANTTYYVRAYAVNSKGVAYGEEVSFTTASDAPAVPEYVDLGLSVKWATFNVGANKPEDYGDYFAWGETEPKTTYDWSNYKWCNGSDMTLTKYNTNSDYGIVDNKITLELSDDAAHVNWGGSWRMPTITEQNELREHCTWTWTTQNGVNGYKVTSNKNGNSIFLPAAGYRLDSSLSDAGSNGYCWSSSIYTYGTSFAYYLYFYSSNVGRNGQYRRYGLSVRPVCP